VPALEIDNREPPEAESERPGEIVSLVIRPRWTIVAVIRLMVSGLTGSEFLKLYCPQIPHMVFRVTGYEFRVAGFRVSGLRVSSCVFRFSIPLFVDILNETY